MNEPRCYLIYCELTESFSRENMNAIAELLMPFRILAFARAISYNHTVGSSRGDKYPSREKILIYTSLQMIFKSFLQFPIPFLFPFAGSNLTPPHSSPSSSRGNKNSRYEMAKILYLSAFTFYTFSLLHPRCLLLNFTFPYGSFLHVSFDLNSAFIPFGIQFCRLLSLYFQRI